MRPDLKFDMLSHCKMLSALENRKSHDVHAIFGKKSSSIEFGNQVVTPQKPDIQEIKVDYKKLSSLEKDLEKSNRRMKYQKKFDYDDKKKRRLEKLIALNKDY